MSGSALKFQEFDVDPANLRGTVLTSSSSLNTRPSFSALLNPPPAPVPVGDAIVSCDMLLDDQHPSAAYASVQESLQHQRDVSAVDKADEELQSLSLKIERFIIGGREESVDCGFNPLKPRWLFLQHLPDKWKVGSRAIHDFDDRPDYDHDDSVKGAAENVKKSKEVSLRDQIVSTYKVLSELLPMEAGVNGSAVNNPVHKNGSFPELRFMKDMISSLIARKYVYSESKKQILDNDRLRERIEFFHHEIPIATLPVVCDRFLFVAVRSLVFRCEEAIYTCMNITDHKGTVTHTAAISAIERWRELCLTAPLDNMPPRPAFSISYKDSKCETKWLHFLTRLKLFTVKDCAYMITQAFVELLALPCQDAIDICAASYLSDMHNQLRPEKPAEQSKKQKQRVKMISSLRPGRFEDLSVVTQANFIYYALLASEHVPVRTDDFKDTETRLRCTDAVGTRDSKAIAHEVRLAFQAVNAYELDGRSYTTIVDEKDKKKEKKKAEVSASLPVIKATEYDTKLAIVVSTAVETVTDSIPHIGVREKPAMKNEALHAINLARTKHLDAPRKTLYDVISSVYSTWRASDNSLERVIAAEFEADPAKRQAHSQKWLSKVASSDVWVACSYEHLHQRTIEANLKQVEPSQLATELKQKKRSLTKLNVFQKAVTDYQQPVAQIASVLKLAYTYNRYAQMDHAYVQKQAVDVSFGGERLTDRIGNVARMRYRHDEGMNPHFKSSSWKPVSDLIFESSWFPIPFGRRTDKTHPCEEERNGAFVARCVEIIQAIQRSLTTSKSEGLRAKRRRLILLDVLMRLPDSPIVKFYNQFKLSGSEKGEKGDLSAEKAETYDLLLYKNARLALGANTVESQVYLEAVIDSKHTQKTTVADVLCAIGDLSEVIDGSLPMSYIPLRVHGTSNSIYRMTHLSSTGAFKSVYDDFQSRIGAIPDFTDRKRQERRVVAAVTDFLNYVGESTNEIFEADYSERFGIALVAAILVLYRTMSRVGKDMSDAAQSKDAKTRKRKCHTLESDVVLEQDVTGPFLHGSHGLQLVFKIGLVPDQGWDVVCREMVWMLNHWHPEFRKHSDSRQIYAATSPLMTALSTGCPILSQLGIRQQPLSVRTMVEAWEHAHVSKIRRYH